MAEQRCMFPPVMLSRCTESQACVPRQCREGAIHAMATV